MPGQQLKRVAKRFIPFYVRKRLRTIQQDIGRRLSFGRISPPPTYDVVYVLTVVGLCGGVRVVLEHVSRLRARGYRVGVFTVSGDASWFPRDVPVHAFGSVEVLQRHLANFRGVKVATWHETAPLVVGSLQGDDRGYYLVQDIEESYGETPEQRERILQTYRLGLRVISEGRWVERQLRDRFELEPIQVHIGLDLDTFQPRGDGARRTQQIMTQARTWSGGVGAGNRIKGWDVAQAVIHRTWAENPQTELLTFSIEDAPKFPDEFDHVHYRHPTDEQLAGLYSSAGIYLLTSRHEGFGLTAAEAMACGCPVVATRADGNEEFCIDGETALTADPGDVETLARHCVRLQRDPVFAAELAARGREFIRQYTWDRVIDRLEAEFAPPPATYLPGENSGDGEASPIDSLKIPMSAVEYPDLELSDDPDCDFTVVIPSVGGADQIAECVASCRRHAEGASLQIVVVDDGCPDVAERERLRGAAIAGGFELRHNFQNLGFSAAVNHGMRRARGESIVLCNSDVLFDRPWTAAVRRAFASDPFVGVVSARLLYPDGKTIQHAGTDKVPGILHYVHSHQHSPAETPAARQNRYVWFATGALVAFRRQTLRQLGGLSTGYALAFEDLDYCLRSWLNGVRVMFCGEWAARHREGGTRGATDQQKRHRPLVWLQREEAGKAFFLKKWAALQFVESLAPFLRHPSNSRLRIAEGHWPRPADLGCQ